MSMRTQQERPSYANHGTRSLDNSQFTQPNRQQIPVKNKVCYGFNSPEGCFRGDNCPFIHVRENGSTPKPEERRPQNQTFTLFNSGRQDFNRGNREDFRANDSNNAKFNNLYNKAPTFEPIAEFRQSDTFRNGAFQSYQSPSMQKGVPFTPVSAFFEQSPSVEDECLIMDSDPLEWSSARKQRHNSDFSRFERYERPAYPAYSGSGWPHFSGYN
eukprot:TRINITY_DN1743_c0_g3_i4.p1 TRINITY_DN1743_c0_g3~~TRINITY_DN1743_c0_g3_i4.p1  ORF type:complete len:214 (-),score=7.36 TRINITY_DN1743_c0_g3_i4:60-701(-)